MESSQKFLLFVFTIFFIIINLNSCSTPLPTISTLSIEDKELRIIYLDYGTLSDDVCIYNLIDSSKSVLLEIPLTVEFPFASGFAVLPSFSNDGKYIIKNKSGLILTGPTWGREVNFEVYDLINDTSIMESSSYSPGTKYEAELRSIQWDYTNDAFYIIQDDTIKKQYINNNSVALLFIENIKDYSVSPSEEYIVASDGAEAILYKNGKEFSRIDLDKTLGQFKYIHSFSWLGEKVAFSVGWSIYLFDFDLGVSQKIECDSEIFDLLWLNENELFFVEGRYPSDLAQMESTKSYKIVHMNLLSGVTNTIYERISQSPLHIKLNLSPSGKLLLFSDRGINSSDSKIKLLTLDGKQMSELIEGSLPKIIQ